MSAFPGVRVHRRAGAHLGDGGPVTLDEAVEVPLALEDLVHQVVVAAARHAVDRVERAHGRVGAGVDRGLERRQVEVPQPLDGHVGRVVVTARLRLAVGREVLRAGHELVRGAVVASLDRLHSRGRQNGVQIGILARSLGDATPAWLVGDVDHRCVRLLEPDGGRLARAVRVVVGRDLRIEARAGGERDREDRPESVDRVEGEEQRDLQPRLFHRDRLKLPDPRGIGHAQHRAEPSPNLCIGDEEVRQQLDLLQLLLQRHLREQVIDPRLDPAVRRPSSGSERLLVARLRSGHHAARGRRNHREDRHSSRSCEPEPLHRYPSYAGSVLVTPTRAAAGQTSGVGIVEAGDLVSVRWPTFSQLSRRPRPPTESCSRVSRSTGCASRATSGSNASRRPGEIRRSWGR